MKLFVMCVIFMNIYVLEECDAKCDQYYLIVKESSCPRENLRPQKISDIDWDEITYPCNSTDPEVIPFNKECVLEVVYHDTSIGCTKHVKKTNYQTHTTIPDERTTITDRYKNIKLLTTTSMTPKADEIEIVHKNETTNEEIDTSLYDVNIIYINDVENNMNTSHSIAETNNTHGEVNCDYAETICGGEDKTENGLNETLKITILRDEKSTVQPIFTGYFSNDSDTYLAPPFKDFKTVNITCNVLKHYNCNANIDKKPVKEVNIYLKTSYVQNNTVSKYFNCTNNFTNRINDSLDLKCNNTDFAEHNKFTLLTHPNVTTTEKPVNVTEQKKLDRIPNSTLDSPINIAKYDLNLIYLNENDDDVSNSTQQTISCAYANICSDTNNPEIETAKSLQMSINRDDTSPIQPIFTGYFDNHTKIQTDSMIKYFKSVTLECAILIRSSCKQSIDDGTIKDINIYLKSNYVQNNTITRYPNCTKNLKSSTSNNTLNFQCEDISFAEHNPHILLTPQLLNITNEVKSDNKTDVKIITRVCVAEENANNKIYFDNCSNDLHFDTAINETTLKNHQNNSNIYIIAADNFGNSTTKPFNAVTNDYLIQFLIPANDNCTKNLGQSIHKGKIINSGINGTRTLGTETFELQVSNCTENNTNNTQPNIQKDLVIFLQEPASNSSNTKLFNESLKEAQEKQNVILQCDLLKGNSSTNNATDRNILKCLSIDLNNHVNTTDNKSAKEKKKVQVNSVRNCTTSKSDCKTNNTHIKDNANNKRNCTASEADCKTNNTSYKDNAKNEITDNKEVKKEVRNYAEVKPDYSKGTFNRKTDIVNGAMKSKNSEEYNEVEKILLIGLSSLAGVSMVVVLALKFRRKSKPSDESESPPASAARPNVAEMDETAF